MDTDQDTLVPTAKQRLLSDYERTERSVMEELATITTSEIQFADAVNACTPHGDVEAQRRCVEGYKKWLKCE